MIEQNFVTSADLQCPNGGGPHTPGDRGEWLGRCTKCGQR